MSSLPYRGDGVVCTCWSWLSTFFKLPLSFVKICNPKKVSGDNSSLYWPARASGVASSLKNGSLATDGLLLNLKLELFAFTFSFPMMAVGIGMADPFTTRPSEKP